MAITSGGGCKDPAPQKFFNHSESPLPPFLSRWGYFYILLEVGGNGRTKKKNERKEKRMNLTRNNPFDFGGDLKTNGNEVREGMN